MHTGFFVGKPDGKRPLGTHRRMWKVNIKIDFEQRRWEIIDWIHVAQYRNKWYPVVYTVMNLLVQLNARISSPAKELSSFQENLCPIR